MIGELFNQRYEVREMLGEGAMGIVYRATDTLLGRDVALKLMSARQLGSNGNARMLEEARAVARLNHPNIVAIYDAGEIENSPFIVMELIHGDSLYEKKPAEIKEILAVVIDICMALEHAHSHGIIHRDLKPENVIITPEGRAKLTDFGLARSGSNRLTVEGSIVGTVFYLAPETVQGKPADERSDLYSLGVMLYELTTGKLPFNADDPLAIISQHLYAPPVPPRALNPKIPPALETAILRLLCKQPEERIGNATELLSILRQVFESRAEPFQTGKLSLLDRVVRGRLVGRGRELEEMERAWRKVSSGESQVLLVTGEPGIGKTRVSREMMARAAVSGAKVLTGECYAEGGMPYAPFAQMLQDTMGLSASNRPDLPELVLSDLARLAPDLQAVYPSLPTFPPMDPQAEQQRIFDSVLAWVSALTMNSPVLMFVDDIHWADSGTIYLLRHLARRSRNMRLLIVLTYREIELDDSSALQNLLYDLSREHLSTRIKLGRLSRDLTAEMISTLLTPSGEIDDDFISAVHQETEGNPFFIEEVCKELIEEGKLAYKGGAWTACSMEDLEIPQSIRLTIQSRLARLPERAQDVLRVAAVLGREFDFELLKQSCDLSEDDLIDALEHGERAQILREMPNARSSTMRFMFEHALIPTTLRESLSGLRRQRMHRRVAVALEASHPEDYETLAYHYEEAGDADQALDNYLKAGQRAMGLYANEEAVKYYRMALELVQGGKQKALILSDLGESLFRSSKSEDAIRVWKQAIDLWNSLKDFDRVAYYYARCGRAAWYINNYPLGLEICRQGMAAVPSDLDTPGMATLLHETARACYFNSHYDEAKFLAQQALELAEQLNLVNVQADTYATLGILPNQPPEECQGYLEKAVELAESAKFYDIASRAHQNLGGHMERYISRREGMKQFERALELSRRIRLAAMEQLNLISIIGSAMQMGDFKKAEEGIQHCREVIDNLPPAPNLDILIEFMECQLDMFRGKIDRAVRRGNDLYREAKKHNLLDYAIMSANVAAMGLYMSNRAEESYALMVDVLDDPKMQDVHSRWDAYITRSITAASTGRLPEARVYSGLALKMMKGGESPLEMTFYNLTLAVIAREEEKWEEAEALFRDCSDSLVKLDLPLHRLMVQTDQVKMYIRRHAGADLEKARQLLNEMLLENEKFGIEYHPDTIREQLKKLES